MEADQTQIESEEKKTSFAEQVQAVPRALLIALAVSLIVLLCLVSAFFYLQNQSRGLKPERPSPTPSEVVVDGQPIVVTFEELNNNATEYQNKWIQITGNYFPKNPTICSPKPSNGPQFESVLVSEGLQLNIRGGEKALAIVGVNTEMVVQGIWRLYTGPVGCGKEPPSDMIWYLDIQSIVQPNPIVASTPAPIQTTPPAEVLPPEVSPSPTANVDESVPTPTNTPIPVTVVVETPAVTNTPTPDLLGTPTAMVTTPTGTPVNGTFTRTPTPNPNATATIPTTGTATSTATPTVTGTPGTAVPTNTPAVIPTATQSGGYPGSTPVPSNTPSGYP